MGDLSPHFSKVEFEDHVTGQVEVNPALVQALERLRAICGGRPLRIVSGYRSVATNKAVGGARNSQHLHGNAADIQPGYATMAQAMQAGFTGIGYDRQGRVIHVDVRPGPAVRFRDGW